MILHHNAADRFSTVAPEWKDLTAVLIGGGPSLTAEQIARVQIAREAESVRVIAVNNAYLIAPWADVCYFADSSWWERHKDLIEFIAWPGQKCTIQNSGANVTDLTVHMLRNKHHPDLGNGLSIDPGVLVSGRHGGFQALNLAVLAGSTRVILLGYDAKPDAEGKTHWHGGHKRQTVAAAYECYRRAFSAAENAIAAAGVKVLNCSPGSAIDSFPKMRIEEAL